VAAHAQPDKVTSWWRGVSLRAKITGVTVSLLVIGLFATGIGTMIFVRNALVANLDASLEQLAPNDLATSLFDIEFSDTDVLFRAKEDVVSPEYYVAIYGPDGAFVAVAGGSGAVPPEFPATFTLEQTNIRGTTPFALPASEGGSPYHASVDVLQVPGSGVLHTQLVALPLAAIDKTVATFFGIFAIFAFITIAAGAMFTRLLVTQAFRQLGQVESAATSIAAGDFRQRLAPGDPRTEVGKLTRALNTMLDNVDTSLSERDATVRQMRRFIGDASHELRTPLVTVRGYAELYRMGAIRGDEDTAQAMERIEKEAVRMGVMVEDLLALARLDERSEVTVGPVDLRPIARDAAMDVRAASPKRTVTVVDQTAAPHVGRTPEQDAAPDTAAIPARRRGAGITRTPLSLLRRTPRPVPASRATTGGDVPAVPSINLRTPPAGPAISRPPVVLAEENRIRQVVANLLGNARRFTPDDSPIEITVGTDLERVSEYAPIGMGWIAISDHGEGVPEQIRANIFERFWRADTSRTRETGGTGLGLAIVASIVDALHGEVTVEDTPGGGATFRVLLPLAPESTLFLDTQPLPELPLNDDEHPQR